MSMNYAEKRSSTFVLAVACLFAAWCHPIRANNLFMIRPLSVHEKERLPLQLGDIVDQGPT